MPHGRADPFFAGARPGQSLDPFAADPGTARSLPPEPIRYVGSLMVRNAIRRKERAEDVGRRPRHLDVRLARFAAAAGKADKGEPLSGRLFSPFGAPFFSFGFDFAQAKVVKAHLIHPSACARLFQPLAQFSFMHLPTTRTLPYQPSANPAGTPARLPASTAAGWNWSRSPSLSNWPSGRSGIAATRVRRTLVTPDFPPAPRNGGACRLHAVPRRCRRRSAAASIATLPDKTDKRAP